MKEQKKQLVNNRVILAISAALFLAACGGGGSGSSASTGNTANLSATQQNYESVALAANGGLHYLHASLVASTSSTGALTVAPSSNFYTDDSSITQSPAAGEELLTVGHTSVSAALSVPTIAVARRLFNGAIYSDAFPAQVRVSYVGSNVQEDYLASDGKTVTHTLLGTNYSVVPLSGLISSSPAELFSNSALGVLTNTINGQSFYNKQANWRAGASYVKVVRNEVGDSVTTFDCLAPVTTGTTPTPCSTTISTLEGFFPRVSTADGKSYQITDGQIVTLAGMRAWVATAPLATATTEYRVFYQYNGGINVGYLVKDGTTLQLAPLGGGTPQDSYYFLNSAAVQSIKAAIAF
ncbi:hypothetical protein A6V36_03500 [Paraburkholderia ginsengiterrae]|uniref:Lipoprotein n=1 Tax=Paraburkholderia ginsengiterrae TaxID=1462993 RepID=A0A1A9NAP5_9BURK|nr:hypothetical protein [Paraburkholderia ginsengiterrae]OAJ58495.1 hypothetical protein A6V36_03500 [Paraburkholderia ginsengiterrae]OAJ62130.1 hypothetical protein A6V37_23685 [Paraburkholderia ginsengiterrae]